ncbi:unnamed protein product [Musa acuminata subsp. malaccensis]|uniref:(wild Malaysian banana) hypothetical protein n=1 Tax=Musa acuminata subsp. malaccensis TaxID=214687 RepID=A0A804ID96_MUSAM|nr:PREDICTED: uncharacterized protein LOC103978549 [Musa acuminata subsp. malaccensis]CAG1850506.1 unnamed protein product [Musa acuminata subsp. malaccensis]
MCFCTTELIRPRSRVDGTQVGADVKHNRACLVLSQFLLEPSSLRLYWSRPTILFLVGGGILPAGGEEDDSYPYLRSREVDRQRSQTRKAQMKQRDDGLTPEQRRERDAKALQEKAAKKAAGAAAGGGGATDSKNKGNAKK